MAVTVKIKPGVPTTLDAGDNPNLATYTARIDAIIWRVAGVSVHDLPDCPYQKWLDARVRPIYAARRALRRAGGDE